MDSDDSDYLPDPERAKRKEDEDHHEPDDPGPQDGEDQHEPDDQGTQEAGEQPEAIVRGRV